MMLTDWESGNDIYISDRVNILAMVRLPTLISDLAMIGGTIREYGERTRVDTDCGTFLVRETPREILAMRMEVTNE